MAARQSSSAVRTVRRPSNGSPATVAARSGPAALLDAVDPRPGAVIGSGGDTANVELVESVPVARIRTPPLGAWAAASPCDSADRPAALFAGDSEPPLSEASRPAR